MKKYIITLILVITSLLSNAQVFTKVDVDKKYHIGAGAVIGVWGTFMGNSLELTPEESALVGIATVTAAGLGKEIWDLSYRIFGDKNAKFDLNDVSATTLGGIVGVGISYAILKIVKKKPPVIYTTTQNGFQIGMKYNF